jgi:large subunit ribosomal protein L24
VKLRKGDRVVVLTGKDRGTEGDVMRVLPDKGKVIVEGVNIVKKHQKQRRLTMQAGIIDKDMPLPASSVALICRTCGKTRIGYKFDAQGRKYRVCKKCGNEV